MYLEKINKKDNANNVLLAASKTKNTNLPAPLAPPRGQVEEPPNEIDCCVSMLTKFIKNHNRRRPNRRAIRRKQKQAESPDQVAAAAEATRINNNNREEFINNTQTQEAAVTTTRHRTTKITNRVAPPIT